MTLAEAIETTRIHRVAGLTGDRTAFVTTRPFRAPHHPIADAGRIGGGHGPRPGEVSRAHHRGRCLEAQPECRSHVWEVLRHPLRRVFDEYNLAGVLNITIFTAFAERLLTFGARAESSSRPPLR
jgi:predicted ATPase with chaperone activity